MKDPFSLLVMVSLKQENLTGSLPAAGVEAICACAYMLIYITLELP
jgi:hypothetical protein